MTLQTAKIAETSTTTTFAGRKYTACRQLLATYQLAITPPESIEPSEWAEKYRVLAPRESESPGPWSNAKFPAHAALIDTAAEALRTGRGWCCIKNAQAGVSSNVINFIGWFIHRYSAPVLYLISIDRHAKEFGRDRFDTMIRNAAPLRRKLLKTKRSRSEIQTKRFTDCKIDILGGQSAMSIESQSYALVAADEPDSFPLDSPTGDPIATAQKRTGAFDGLTLIMAFSHPTIRARGTAKIYYAQSDQRRGFVTCCHCKGEFFFSWDHVRAIAHTEDGEKETQEQADVNPDRYAFFAPCCGTEISDVDRIRCLNAGVTFKSTLSPEEAATKAWIGVHVNAFYQKNKTLRELATEYIQGLADPTIMRVFVNKTMGEPYESKISESHEDDWRRLIVVPRHDNDPREYSLGEVPPGVRFLTAGQDSRSIELHYTVWGWGLLRDTAGIVNLCGWLIDCGVIPRPYSLTLDAADLAVFDQLIYNRRFPSTDGKHMFRVELGLHDAGWQEIAAYQFCRRHRGRAWPCKGAAVDSRSVHPSLRWGAAPRYQIDGVEVRDPSMRLALLNTFTLKEVFYDMARKSFRLGNKTGATPEIQTRLVLPRGSSEPYPDMFCQQISSEYQSQEKNKLVWKHKGPNHFADCSIYAFAACENLDPFQHGLPFDEVERQRLQDQTQEAQHRKQSRSSPKGETPRGPINRRY